MSVDAADDGVISIYARIRDELISRAGLTADTAKHIDEIAESMGLTFAETATRLGIITDKQLVDAMESLREGSWEHTSSTVEEAFPKEGGHPGLPVKYVSIVEPGSALILAHGPDSAYSEKIRALRTELVLLNGVSPRVGSSIALLSPCRGEGRTQLSAELAIAFSQIGSRTLLVDADLRRPRMHLLFNCENFIGLAQSLAAGGASPMLGVRDLPNLSLLTAGSSITNPLEMLSNGSFERQMSDWRKKHDMVIIDTPPIGEYADGLAIASFAEQVLIVSRAGATPHKDLKEMLRRLAGTRSRIVGAVINKF